MKQGQKPSQTFRFTGAAFFRATGKAAGGATYERLRATLRRLQGTSFISMPIVGWEVRRAEENLGFIQSYRMVEESKSDSRQTEIEEESKSDARQTEIEIVLTDRFYESILNHKEVLALDHEYFSIPKITARRLYELARKHVGHQSHPIQFSERKLQKKMGSQASVREFRRMMSNIIKDGIPGYRVRYNKPKKMYIFENKAFIEHSPSKAS